MLLTTSQDLANITMKVNPEKLDTEMDLAFSLTSCTGYIFDK